jgi:hypothetical protein
MNCHRFAQAGTIVGTQARWDHKAVYDLIWGALPMIEDGFDARTLANMNVALETGLSAKAGRRGSQGTQARGSADHTVQVRAPKPLRTSCIFGIEAVSFCRALKIPDIVSRTWPIIGGNRRSWLTRPRVAVSMFGQSAAIEALFLQG